ncbi:hypothetical protein, partial [Endozoicomonas sp. YOMI1]|uniref:hypothetical protein n=1 Tax=Endozoicomonas sp. YOMI1 TaxID=2828739 RepID=UPI002147416A
FSANCAITSLFLPWRYPQDQYQLFVNYVLLDCWFMRSHVIKHIQNLGYHAIGQCRHDLALFSPPLPETKRRGKPKIYGEQLTKELSLFV